MGEASSEAAAPRLQAMASSRSAWRPDTSNRIRHTVRGCDRCRAIGRLVWSAGVHGVTRGGQRQIDIILVPEFPGGLKPESDGQGIQPQGTLHMARFRSTNRVAGQADGLGQVILACRALGPDTVGFTPGDEHRAAIGGPKVRIGQRLAADRDRRLELTRIARSRRTVEREAWPGFDLTLARSAGRSRGAARAR